MIWLIPRSELTPDQIRAIELPPSEHRAIMGGPGSGKTQVLLHRARFLADTYRVSPERFRIFVFTNVLKDYIRSALSLLGLPDESVLTFDLWCKLHYQQHISSRVPWDSDRKQPDFAAIRRAIIGQFSGQNGRAPVFEFVLVDEAQDLDPEVFGLLTKIARHVTVCIDNKQQIYEAGSAEAEILERLGLRRRNVNLIDAFRVCPYLVEVAAQLIRDSAEREAFRQQKRTVQTERQTPLVYFANDFEDEKRMLVQVVRERQLMNDRVAILFPQNRQVFGFAQGLTEAGIEVEVPKQHGGSATLPAHDFTSNRPKLMSYHSAKGLTFDSVLMPRLLDSSFRRVSAERLERLVFVALTRATKWAYLSTNAAEPPSFLARLLSLEAGRQISVKRGSRGEGTEGTATETEKKAASQDLDFL